MRYRIKEIREKKKMTQQKLADLAGCSRQYLNELENTNARNVSSRLLFSISNILDCNVDDIFLTNKSDISD